MEKILLPNRYEDKNYLELVSESDTHKVYRFVGDTEFLRIIGNNPIMAIDPSGGPFMGVDNFTLEDGSVLQEISFNPHLTFKKNEKV